MESHGGDVELLGIDDGVARLRLEGHCKGCPASAATLELAIKEAIDEAAPDLLGPRGRGRRRRPASRPGRRPGCCRSRCPTATAAPPPTPDVDAARRGRRRRARRAAHASTLRGAELVVANVDGTLLAYRSACAGCDAGLGDATLSGEILTCARCGRGFDLPRAGRALGRSEAPARAGAAAAARGHEGEGGAAPMTRSRRPARASAERRRPACGACARAAGARRGAAAPAATARRAATCAAPRCPRTIATCCDVGERRILCACEPCIAMRAGEGDLRPDRDARRCAWTTSSLADELWAAVPDPDRPGLLLASARSPAASSRSTRARPARPSASCYLEAWNELVAANPVLADLEPEVEALVVNRLVDPHALRHRARSIAATSSWG